MPKYAVDVNGVRRYWHPRRHDRGYVYRSVTNVTGALPKPALLYWAANETARFATEHLESWEKLPAVEAYDLLRKSPWRTRDRAAAKGTTIHAVADGLLTGKKRYEVESVIEPWVNSFVNFVRDAKPEVEATEMTGYSEKTLTAGTFDFLGRLRNAPELGRCLIDWKTSKGVYPDMAVQVVGGYGLGFEYLLDDDDNEVEWKPPDTCAIVHLGPDGYGLHLLPMDKIFRRAFIACLEIRKWEEEGPKIGEPYLFAGAVDDLTQGIERLKDRLSTLSLEDRLSLMTRCDEYGITTIMSKMTSEDVKRILALMPQQREETRQ